MEGEGRVSGGRGVGGLGQRVSGGRGVGEWRARGG